MNTSRIADACRWRRSSRTFLAGVGALLVVGTHACGREPRLADDGNVILITIDTLRADYLGCYGHPHIKTPVIDRLATTGVQFRRAYAQSHITMPSHVSILTSLYPRDHGVTENRRFSIEPGLPSLAAELKREGFRTVAVTSNSILRPRQLRGLGGHFDAFYSPKRLDRDAAATNAIFFRWLRANHDERFFAWIHYFDPHLPYVPPESYRRLYYEGDPRDQRFTSMDEATFPAAWTNKEHPSHRLVEWLDGIRDFRYAVSQYEGEITYVDAMIGELLNTLKALGLSRRTLIVLTADHGESLDEHGIFLGHFTLYEPSVHVPLIFWAPGLLTPRVIDDLVMSVDIMPTILDIAGVEEQPHALRGKSLLPLLVGQREAPHEYVYAEGNRGAQIMVRSGEWKYIETTKPVVVSPRFRAARGQREAFDLVNDPGETTNVYGREDVPDPRGLEAALTSWATGVPGLATEKPKPPDKPDDYLRALGYAE